ncbi:hypothetical protein [Achromobacter sp. Marseille-Q4962]|uniref:hypothetical protein n=1 Tax=Achromobacter sp. Marseille-Q4962 TaxID=2942202 RepID=UPI00207377BB|nr:hypothetical protein [Achromobacter sp. Marseille-Q4962]
MIVLPVVRKEMGQAADAACFVSGAEIGEKGPVAAWSRGGLSAHAAVDARAIAGAARQYQLFCYPGICGNLYSNLILLIFKDNAPGVWNPCDLAEFS